MAGALVRCAGGGLLLIAACGTPAPVRVEASWAFAPATPSEAAAYLHLRNPGARADTLLAVTSPIAGDVMLHQAVADGAMMRMEHLPVLPLPAGRTTTMEPGGLHLMLTDLDRLPAAGDTIELHLRFGRTGEVVVRVPVIAYGAETPGGTP